jgi:hypothetical protein
LERLRRDPHLVYAFIGPSGHGLKYAVRIPLVTTNAAYRRAWEYVAARHLTEYGLTWDPSAKDIARLCFVSHDPYAYLNEGEPAVLAIPAPPPPPPPSRRPPATYHPDNDYDLVRSMLDAIPNHDVEYYTWLQIGMALHSTGESWACGLWEDWSQQSQKYSASNQRSSWRTFNNAKGTKVTMGTLVKLAQQHGWQDPRQRKAGQRIVPDMTRPVWTPEQQAAWRVKRAKEWREKDRVMHTSLLTTTVEENASWR